MAVDLAMYYYSPETLLIAFRSYPTGYTKKSGLTRLDFKSFNFSRVTRGLHTLLAMRTAPMLGGGVIKALPNLHVLLATCTALMLGGGVIKALPNLQDPAPEAVSSIVCVPQTSSGEDHHDIVPASSFGTTKDEDADADSSDIAGTADGGTSNEHVAGSLGMEEVLDVPGVAANSLGKEEVDGEEGSSSASSWHNAHAQEAGVTSEEGRGESRGDAQNQGVEDAEEGKAVGVTEGEASAQSTGAEVEDGHVLRSQGGPEGVGSISQQVGGSASEGEIEDGWMRSESEEQTDGGVGDNVSEHREGRSDEAGRQDRHGEGEEAGSGSVQGSMDGHDGWKWEWLEGQWHWVPAEGVSTGDTGGHGLSDGKEVGEHSEENKVEDNGRTEL
eukprot:1149602-Pelagomonas_calceolata.AAC.1